MPTRKTTASLLTITPRTLTASRSRGLPRPPYLLLVTIVSVSIVLGILHNRWRSQGKIDPTLAPLRMVLMPFQTGANRLEGDLLDSWQWIFRSKMIRDENVRLQSEVSRLQQENERLRADADEVNRLRTMLKFAPHLPKPWLAGEVISIFPSPNFDTITVSRGSADGVRDATIARTPAGLVGQVTDVSINTCQVMLLTDIGSSISANIIHGGKIRSSAIVRGAGRGQSLSLIYLKREANIRPGDKVISSGYGGVVPPGIMIGRVVSVQDDKNALTKSAKAVPTVPLPGGVHEVFLLR